MPDQRNQPMSLAAEVLARRMRLPVAQTREVVCERDLRAAMDDGAELLADRWVAHSERDRPQPTVLVRSPYGRRQWIGLIFGRLLAERGLQVVIQSVRGTFGSGGSFSPFDERADGLATLRWIRRQPWHTDRIGMLGPSYLGLVQWALAPDAGDDLAALAVQVSASQFHGQTYAWVVRDFAAGVAKVSAPVQLIGGWYDIFLPWMLEDFQALRDAGREPQLVIGPWSHTAPGLMAAGIREGLAWLRARLLDDERVVRPAPVMVRLTGERTESGWRELPAWPPPGMREWHLWLDDQHHLRTDPPTESGLSGDRYRYDPLNPTPSVGGPVLLEREPVVDNRSLEARADVLTYTTAPLPVRYEAIGPVRVELWVSATEPNFDIFARVCDVARDGASWNVCDALMRVAPERLEPGADGTWRVAFALWPTGHRFAAGHRIRLQLSSGAHPRYVRNPGTGEDPLEATILKAVELEVRHDREHPSALVLPRLGSPPLS